MKLKLLHKGLVIVAVPLSIELTLIFVLGYLLMLTDQTQAVERSRSRVSLAAARVVFANCNTGSALIRAWTEQEPAYLEGVTSECARIERLIDELKQAGMTETDPKARRAFRLEKDLVRAYLAISEISAKGFDPGTLKKVILVQNKLILRLRDGMALMKEFQQETAANLKEAQERLKQLKRAEFAALGTGFVINILCAFFLWRYFTREIRRPLETIKDNIRRLGRGMKLNPPLEGEDEIAQFDNAFHRLSDELASAAERERALFDNTGDVIGVIDTDWRFVRLNRTVERVLLYDPAELAGGPMAAVVPEQYLERCRERLTAAWAAADRSVTFETEMRRKNGETLSTLWSVFWSQEHECWSCIIHDFSEQKMLDRLKSSFLQLIAADFRKPLDQIAQLFDSLAAGRLGRLPGTAAVKVKNALGTLSRLLALVDQLLYLEQVQGREFILERRDHNVKAMLIQAREDVEAQARAKSIAISVECSDLLESWVDENNIVRVIVNLLANAVKFSPPGTAITLSAISEDDRVKITVKDQGRGMTPEQASNLFRPFQQIDAADGRRGKGTGLGLVICKKIVEQHGGQIGVETSPERGSAFWFRLPRTEPSDQAAQPENQSPPASPTVQASKHVPSSLARRRRIGIGWNLKTKSLLLIGVPLLFESCFVGAMSLMLYQGHNELSDKVAQRSVQFNAVKMTLAFYAFSLGLREITQTSLDRARLDRLLDTLPRDVEAFRHAAVVDPLGRRFATKFLPASGQLLALCRNKYEDLQKTHSGMTDFAIRNEANEVFEAANDFSQETEALLDECDSMELIHPLKQAEIRQSQGTLLLAGVVANALAAVGLAVFFSAGIAARLNILSDNTRKLALSMPLHPPLGGNDEIGELDAAFHQMARELADARAKERAYLENSVNIICALDEEAKIMLAGRAVEKVLGRSPQQLLHSPFLELVHPGDQESCRQRLEEARSTDAPVVFETRLLRFDRLQPAHLDAARETGAAAALTEAIELQQATGFRAREPDDGDSVSTTSDAFTRFAPVQQGAFTRTATESDARSPDSTSPPDPESIDVLCSLYWSRAEGSFYCVAHDISRRKELERLKKEFLAVVSHDLRTPIATISGTTTLLQSHAFGPVPESTYPVLQEIKRQSEHLLELVNDLLDLEKLEAGKMTLALSKIDIGEIVQRAAQQVRQRRASLQVELAGDGPDIVIDADIERLARAFANLLLEASTLSSEPITISIDRTADGDGVTVNLFCSVNASDESVRSLLEKIHSSESSVKAKGARDQELLRLPLARRIVEAHSGKISTGKTASGNVSLEIFLPAAAVAV